MSKHVRPVYMYYLCDGTVQETGKAPRIKKLPKGKKAKRDQLEAFIHGEWYDVEVVQGLDYSYMESGYAVPPKVGDSVVINSGEVHKISCATYMESAVRPAVHLVDLEPGYSVWITRQQGPFWKEAAYS